MPRTIHRKTSGDAKKDHMRRRRSNIDSICACGCGGELPEPVKPSLKRNFLQGHDAKLKSLVLRKSKGERVRIPSIALKKASEIPFLASGPLAEAIAAR